MFEYLQSLSVINQALLSFAIAVGLSNSLKNYAIYWIALFTGRGYNQGRVGKLIDWCWLSLVIYLTIALE